MPRYNEGKYGQVKYGSGTISAPSFGLVIDFENEGYFSGRNDGFRLQRFSVERGRRHYVKPDGGGFEEEMTGRFSGTVADPSETYNPFNSLSSLTGKLRPNRPMRLMVRTPDNNVYNLFTGTLTDFKFRDDTIPMVSFEGADGWDFLRSKSDDITVPLQQGVNAKAAIELVLAAVGWRWGSTLYDGMRTIPYWWVESSNAAKEIFDIVFSEVGRVFLNGDGELNFEAYAYWPDVVATLTDSDLEDGSLEFSSPWETQKNSVTVFSNPRAESFGWFSWSAASSIKVAAGAFVTFDADFNFGGLNSPSITYAPAPVGGVDFVANAAEDGYGVELTSSFSITVTPKGDKATVRVTNSSGTAGYLLTGATIRVAACAVLWTLSEALPVPAYGSAEFFSEFKYSSELVPALLALTPLPTLGYKANTAADGSGGDLTTAFSLVLSPAGNKVSVRVYNNSGSAGYLLEAQIVGICAYKLPKGSATESIIANKEDRLELVLDYNNRQSASYASFDAEMLMTNLSQNKPYISFSLKPNPNLQFKIDVGCSVELNFSKLGGLKRMRVAYVKHDFDMMAQSTKTTLFCEPMALLISP